MTDAPFPFIQLFLIAIIIGCIPGAIAQHKGRSFVGWWLFGTLLFIVALPASLIVGRVERTPIKGKKPYDYGTEKKCPYCAEIIKAEAVVCRFCGRDQPLSTDTPIFASDQSARYPTKAPPPWG